MEIIEIPIARIRTGFLYLKGTPPGRRVPLDLEEPVTVIAAGAGRYELVDGFKRLAALRRREKKSVLAAVRNWSPLQAKAMMLGLNARRRTLSFYEEAVLAADLHEKENLSFTGVARLLRRKKSWVVKRAGIIARLDADLLELLKTGRLGPRSAYNLSRLPRKDQLPMFLAIGEEKLTALEVEAAVALLLSLPEPERSAALGDLRALLAGRGEREAVLGEPAAGIAVVEEFIRAARRVREQFISRPRPGTDATAGRVYRAAVKKLKHELFQLEQALADRERPQNERRVWYERKRSAGKDCPGHGPGGKVDPAYRPGPGDGPEAGAEGVGAGCPDAPLRRREEKGLEAGPVPGTDPGAGGEDGSGGAQGTAPDREEYLPAAPPGGLPGRDHHSRRLRAGDPRQPAEPEGLRPLRAAARPGSADGLVSLPGGTGREENENSHFLPDPLLQPVSVPGGFHG